VAENDGDVRDWRFRVSEFHLEMQSRGRVAARLTPDGFMFRREREGMCNSAESLSEISTVSGSHRPN
jgi:hypothetical protein